MALSEYEDAIDTSPGTKSSSDCIGTMRGHPGGCNSRRRASSRAPKVSYVFGDRNG
jgi:hypothetical protein